MILVRPTDFSEWRDAARTLIAAKVRPDQVVWGSSEEDLLFGGALPEVCSGPTFSVPAEFVRMATRASLHRDLGKWALLYRVLWRIRYETKELLQVATDLDVSLLGKMEGEVRRDCHKMKAFVRFRKSGDDRFIAWHEPSHLVVKAVSPFFARRFSSMDWAILTPDCCAYWDRQTLRFGPGLTKAHAPASDELEELWKTYYANIFNPARVKVSAMVSEMPKKYWHTMPETAIIGQLLANAAQREQEMIQNSTSERKAPYQVVRQTLDSGGSLKELKAAAMGCQGCELCHTATQTVFGMGPHSADMMLIGEQPGDHEDRNGEPFLGPAGQLLRRCLKRVGVEPEKLYLTNVVKHFRWEASGGGGKRRLHKRATWRQIDICEPWVRAEIQLVRPRVIVLLGATALQTLVGREYEIGKQRGRPLPSDLAPNVLATVHPSSLLRIKDNRRQQLEIDRFCQDLKFGLNLTRPSRGFN